MRRIFLGLVLLGTTMLTACGQQLGQASPQQPPPLVIGGIPDQDLSTLQERFDSVAAYLARELGLPVVYRPSVDYAALVTAFGNGDVLLGWFGGLTGVQARREVAGAHALAQRPRDKEFHSVFIVGAGVEGDSIQDLEGLSFTFGSESSTSGHLMPRYFLGQAGIEPERDFRGQPSYSGSHDKTWKLVEAGSFQAGVLNEAVWEDAVNNHQVDGSKVRVIERTPAYHDYHWLAHPKIDEIYGVATVERIKQALLAIDETNDPGVQHTLQLFDTTEFVPTDDDNYAQIEQVARDLGLLGS